MARTANRGRGECTWCAGTAAVLLLKLKGVGGLEERVQVWMTLPWVLAANAMAAAAAGLGWLMPGLAGRTAAGEGRVCWGACGCVCRTDQSRGYGTRGVQTSQLQRHWSVQHVVLRCHGARPDRIGTVWASGPGLLRYGDMATGLRRSCCTATRKEKLKEAGKPK